MLVTCWNMNFFQISTFSFLVIFLKIKLFNIDRKRPIIMPKYLEMALKVLIVMTYQSYLAWTQWWTNLPRSIHASKIWQREFIRIFTFRRLLRPGVKLTPRRIRYPTRRRLERISLFTTDLLVRLQRPLGKASFVLIYLSRLRSDGRTDWLSASARLPSSPGCALQRTEASFSFDAPVVRPGQKVRAKISVEGDEIFCALAIRDVRGGPLPLTSDFSTTEVLRRINRGEQNGSKL